MNLLSITASFGALEWIFEDGHLASLLHFEPGPIDLDRADAAVLLRLPDRRWTTRC